MLLFRNPRHDKTAARQSRDRRGALVVIGELIDQEFTADRVTGGRQNFGIDIQQTVRNRPG